MLPRPCLDVAASVVTYMRYACHVRKLHAGLLAVWSRNMTGITTTEVSRLTTLRTRSLSPDPGSRRRAMTKLINSLESN